MNLRTIFLAAGVLACGHPAVAVAWNEYGHTLVAKVAYDQLVHNGDKAVRDRLDDILQKHPHRAHVLDAKRPTGADAPSEAEWRFLRAATWPDWVRPAERQPDPDPVHAAAVRYHRPDDHFTNTPVFRPGADAAFVERVKGLPDRYDVVCALKGRESELTSRFAEDDDKAVALCWLVHLAGDIHQPLHCATLFSDGENEFPRGDLGGNSLGVRIGGRGWKLHAYWDDVLGPEAAGGALVPPDKLYAQVRTAAPVLQRTPFDRAGLPELDRNRSFASWAAESHQAAVETAYRKGELKGTALHGDKVQQQKQLQAAPKVEEQFETYAADARATANRRAALAGHRLADLLRSIIQEEARAKQPKEPKK